MLKDQFAYNLWSEEVGKTYGFIPHLEIFTQRLIYPRFVTRGVE